MESTSYVSPFRMVFFYRVTTGWIFGIILLCCCWFHIQRIVLATEETTVWRNKSAIDLSNYNPACGHKELSRSTGHNVVTTRYSDQQGSRSRQKVMWLCKQWHRPIPKQFIKPLYSYREQPRLTRIVLAYLPPAFSATKRPNYAPFSFDQQVQVSQGHPSYKNKENWNTEVHGDGRPWAGEAGARASIQPSKALCILEKAPRILPVRRSLCWPS